jgi:hypothetical protein
MQTAPACATKYEAETMREDEDQFRYYVPLLRRIIILVAVITAIPVILWTITAFVRTYVAPPKLPSFRPMTATASIAAPPVPDNTGKPGAAPQQAAPAQPAAAATMVEARATATDARDGAPAAKGSLIAEPPAEASPGALPPRIATLTAGAPAPADAAPKADTMTPMTFDAPPQNKATAIAVQQPAAPTDATGDALPAAAPLHGPVPLPRRRPHNLAVADLGVPMPRPRPGESDAPANPMEWIRSIFQQPPSPGQQSEPQQ